MRKGAAGGAFVLPGDSGAIVTGLKDLYHLGAITPQQLTDARIWLSDVVVRVACQRATGGLRAVRGQRRRLGASAARR